MTIQTILKGFGFCFDHAPKRFAIKWSHVYPISFCNLCGLSPSLSPPVLNVSRAFIYAVKISQIRGISASDIMFCHLQLRRLKLRETIF